MLRADLTIAARALLTMPLRYLKLTPEYNCSLLFPVFDPIESLATIKNVLSQSDENTKIVVFLNGPGSRDRHINMLKFYDNNMTIIRSRTAQGSIGALNVLLAYDYLCHRSLSFSIVSDHDELSHNWYPVMQETLLARNQ